jgi:hypothetical protein
VEARYSMLRALKLNSGLGGNAEQLTTQLREAYLAKKRASMAALDSGDVSDALNQYAQFASYIYMFESMEASTKDPKRWATIRRDAFALLDMFQKELASRLAVRG